MSHFTKIHHRKPYEAISPALPQLAQSGRTVLITGGGTGIGFATARAFVAAKAARVIIASRTESKLAQSKADLEAQSNSTTTIGTLALDLASEASIDGAWADLKDRGIEVDVLILNAAGIQVEVQKISEPGHMKEIRSAYDVNVFGNLQMAASFIAQGPRQGKVLINVSSGAVHMNPVFLPVYATTKLAFTHAMQALADEVPREEVLMVSVHPGTILTENGKKKGLTENALPFDSEDLPAHFIVWASSKEAAFLHGRFLWAHWDVDELRELGERFKEDAELLRIALKGTENTSMAGWLAHMSEIDGRDYNAPFSKGE